MKSLITHRFAFESALDAYQLITAERPEPHLGVLLAYQTKVREQTSDSAASNVPRARPRREEVGIAFVGTGGFATGVLLPAFESDVER